MKRTSTRVALRIMGDNFNIDYITKRLSIIPTKTWNNGESIRNTGKFYTYTAWIYSTSENESLDINSELKKIECLFIPKTEILCELKKELSLSFSIDVVIIIENQEPPAIYLEDKIIKFASEIGARFDMDTYVN